MPQACTLVCYSKTTHGHDVHQEKACASLMHLLMETLESLLLQLKEVFRVGVPLHMLIVFER